MAWSDPTHTESFILLINFLLFEFSLMSSNIDFFLSSVKTFLYMRLLLYAIHCVLHHANI